jgi:hypothetical protein
MEHKYLGDGCDYEKGLFTLGQIYNPARFGYLWESTGSTGF